MSSLANNPDARPILWATTSWDDGYPLDLRLAELLDRYGIPGTFYVPVRSAMPVLDARQVRELARGFEIGGHTVNHFRLDSVSSEVGRKEIVDSKQWLEDITGVSCNMFCPPDGRYGRDTVAHIRQAGYWGVRTVELMSIESPPSRDGIVFLPTTLQLYHHRPITYLKNAAKRRRWKNVQNYLRFAPGSDLVRTTDSILEKLLVSGGMFHLWGHSWELEHSRLWGTLETILKRLHACRGRCRFVVNGGLCGETRRAWDFPKTKPGSATEPGRICESAIR